MKKISKILLSIVLTFVFTINVSAYSVGDKITIEKASDPTDTRIGCIGCYAYNDANGTTHQFDRAYITQYELSDGSPAYCMDAHLQAYRKVKVDKVISSDTSESKYYIGLAAIGAAGYSNSNTSMGGISGSDFYAATNIAIRMYAIAMGHGKEFSSGSISGSRFTYQLANTTARWMENHPKISNDATGYNCVATKNKTLKKCFEEKINLAGITLNGNAQTNAKVRNNYLSGGTILNVAKDLLKIGMEAAANNSVNSSSASISNNTALSSKVENTEIKFIKKDYYTITSSSNNLENVSNISASCKNCNSVSGSPTISITGYYLSDGTTYKTGVPTANDLKNNKKLYLEITGTINRNAGYDCTDLEYTINYNLATASFDYTVYILKAEDSSVVKKAQRFYAIVTDSDSNTDNTLKSVDKKMDFCGGNYCEYYDPKDFEDMTEEEFEDYTEECCTDLDKLCNDKTNPAQQDYCDMYSEYCAACDTEIVVPSVCTYIEGVDGEQVAEDMTGYVKSAIDDDGNENIRACLLMRKKDEAGHSYKEMENSYCKVFCKEDYTYDLPTAVSVNSGTYFQLEATISGTKSCYTSEIDTEKFKADISGLSTSSDVYKQKVNEYNACVNMEVKYDCFNPEIEYEYEEIYNDQLGDNNKFVQTGNIVETDKSTTYCNGDINDDYSCKDGSTKEVSNIEGVAFTTKYVKSTVKKTGIYKTPSVFYTQHPSGAITTDKNANNITLIDGLPVSISTDKGRHKFTLSLKNIGEYYDQTSCKSGRIIGDENSIYDTQNKANGKTGIFSAEYMCYYDVNCPECEFDCEGPLCNIDQCDGNGCVATCVGNGCAYSEAGLSYAYRTVSLNSLNPNEQLGRKLGYNWSTEKAQKTIDDIEAKGEKAYESPEYSFTLTPALITAIKEYNKSQLSNGGYTNETLTCSDDKYGNENVNCESDFITKLVNGDIGTANNKVTVPADDEKFTSWLDSEYCNGTCTITKGSGIGPSWK